MSEKNKNTSDNEEAIAEQQNMEVNRNEEAPAEGEEDRSEEEVQEMKEAASVYEDYRKEELIDLLISRDLKIEELEERLNEAEENHLRKAAELENYRKRVQRERTQIYETAKASAIEDFFSVNDDLRRTLKASEDLDVNPTFLDGVTLVADKFEEVMKKHGVERIDEEMVPFDVDLHDAMMRRKADDEEVESDMVLNVIENGYRLGDRTIRHAKVTVSE